MWIPPKGGGGRKRGGVGSRGEGRKPGGGMRFTFPARRHILQWPQFDKRKWGRPMLLALEFKFLNFREWRAECLNFWEISMTCFRHVSCFLLASTSFCIHRISTFTSPPLLLPPYLHLVFTSTLLPSTLSPPRLRLHLTSFLLISTLSPPRVHLASTLPYLQQLTTHPPRNFNFFQFRRFIAGEKYTEGSCHCRNWDCPP